MSTAELKEKLIGEISRSRDEVLLLEMCRLMQIESSEVSVYPLTDNQLSMVKEAQAEVRSGNYLTEEEANKDIEKWLEE